MTELVSDWHLTSHARQQMRTRQVAADALEHVLREPQYTLPDPKRRENCRYYIGDGVIAVVDEADRTVITVGLDGASSSDWRSYLREVTPVAASRPPASRAAAPRSPVDRRNILDGVHPGIADTVRQLVAEFGVDFRSVKVHSPTKVEVLLP